MAECILYFYHCSVLCRAEKNLYPLGRYFILPPPILIKMAHFLNLDPNYIRNTTDDFNETLHVGQACPKKGFGTIGMCRYPLVQKLWPIFIFTVKCPYVRICPLSLCPNVRMSMSEYVRMTQLIWVKTGRRRRLLNASLVNLLKTLFSRKFCQIS